MEYIRQKQKDEDKFSMNLAAHPLKKKRLKHLVSPFQTPKVINTISL